MADTKVTISLRKRLIRLHKNRRLRKAPDYLRERVAKLANVSVDSVKIHKDINNLLLVKVGRGMQDFDAEIRKEATYVEVRPVGGPRAAQSGVKPVSKDAKPAASKKGPEEKAKAAASSKAPQAKAESAKK